MVLSSKTCLQENESFALVGAQCIVAVRITLFCVVFFGVPF